MSRQITTIVLLMVLGLSGLILADSAFNARLPGNDQGYEPEQPIRFSHRLHAGEMGIDCLYCHSGADKSRHAGIPAASTCMNCHKFVTAPLGAVREEDERAAAEGRSPRRVVSPEIRKIYDALGLDEQLARDQSRPQKPIEWVQVHNLPDFVFFSHSAHVNAGVECQTCHG